MPDKCPGCDGSGTARFLLGRNMDEQGPCVVCGGKAMDTTDPNVPPRTVHGGTLDMRSVVGDDSVEQALAEPGDMNLDLDRLRAENDLLRRQLDKARQQGAINAYSFNALKAQRDALAGWQRRALEVFARIIIDSPREGATLQVETFPSHMSIGQVFASIRDAIEALKKESKIDGGPVE